MSFAQTQWLALGINVVLGLAWGSVGGFNPLLGIVAMYVTFVPAGIVHLVCGLCEGEASRREDARSYPPIDRGAESRRIANAGYPEQHRLFFENRLLRAGMPGMRVAPATARPHVSDRAAPSSEQGTPLEEESEHDPLICGSCGWEADKVRRRCSRCAAPLGAT